MPSKLLFCKKLAYDSAVPIGTVVDEDVDVDAIDFIDAVDAVEGVEGVDPKEMGASFEESEKGTVDVEVDDVEEEIDGFRRG